MELNNNNLSIIKKQLPCPSYDRSQLKTGIVHIGVGGFHRSHQAYYIHRLLTDGAADWAICGIGLREADREMARILKDQDCLYTLVTQHSDGTAHSEVIGSIVDYLFAIDHPQAVIDKLAHPDTRIVSLTITEGGYNYNPATGAFDFENKDIQHDLIHLDAPTTVYGYLMAGLRIRKVQGLPPFTILSCDNIQHNGDVAREMLLTFAQKQDPELAEWMAETIGFPNTMVDRITPVTDSRVIEYLHTTHDVEDQWPVVCEPFIQWVVEDNFTNGRPPLESLGVQFVPDVTPYEKMKIRLLNAGHSVLGIPGALHGHPTIDACMHDPVFSTFMRKFMDVEVTPILGKIKGIDIEKYKDTLEERFANPNIKDSVSRICSESAAKLPKFLIPSIKENLKSGGSIEYATLILAAWCYYSDKGINEQGDPLEIIDEQKDTLHQSAKNTEKDAIAFLRQDALFGDLIKNERFVKEYTAATDKVYGEKNIRKIMESIIN